MVANALVQTRIDAEVRDRASAVLENMGLSLAVNGLIIDRMPRFTSRLQFLCQGIMSVRLGADGRPLSEQEPLAARQIF